jgi:peptide/nickel transport system permease protein
MIRAFLRDRNAILAFVVLGIIVAVAIGGPGLMGGQADALDPARANENPTGAHWLGTDRLGRDILVRLLVGTRLTIGLALVAAGIAAVIGISAGAVAAILPGRLRTVALRTIDALLAFPVILVAIVAAAITGPGGIEAALAVGVGISSHFARLASSLALSIGGREFIAAARVTGVSRARMLFRHILPNLAETMAIQTTASVGSCIVAVSSLSFLGLGVQPPQFDWGRMLTEGVSSIYLTPAAAIGPAVAIAITALAFGFFGEGIARAANPLLWAGRSGRGPRSAAHDALGPAPIPSVPLTNEVAALSSGLAREPVLEVRDLIITFPGAAGALPVVAGVTFSVGEGEMVGIVGESGSGKTMTAMAIAQLVPYPGSTSGTINLRGADVRSLSANKLDTLLGTDLAVVFQDPMSSLNPALKIGTQLTEGVEWHHRMPRKQARALAAARLREVNIPTVEQQLQRHPHELSGGMRQRVMIAMGLMHEPVLLIADEPTTALDVTIQAQIMDLLHRINSTHNTAVILITHNLALVSQSCQRVLVMYAGRIVEDLAAEQLMAALHPYTRALLSAVPDLNLPRNLELAYIPGHAPDASEAVTGCPYHPRCPLVIEKCRNERPTLAARPGSHRVACWVANGDVE